MDPKNMILAHYNAIDSAVTRKCFDVIQEEVIKSGYIEQIEDTNDLCEVLLYLQTRGILINKDSLKVVRARVEKEIAENQELLDSICGYPLNVNSNPQCTAYFYGFLGLPPYTSRTTGNPTTDDKTLVRIFRKGGKGSKEAKIVQRLRGLLKLQNTYLLVIIDKDGRVRSSFNPRGTKAGRISSSQTVFGTGMNFQNIDPRFKSFMVADEGHMMIEIDKAQAEWVVTAYVSGDGDMMHVCESGIDPHVYTGTKISHLPIEVVVKEHEHVGHATDPLVIEAIRRKYLPALFDDTYERIFLPRIFSIRQAGKKSNHALNYKEGYKRFAFENEMTEREAKPIVESYRLGYPGLERYWEEVERDLMKNRTLTNCYGDRRRFLGALDHNTLESAISYIPQSTVGKLINNGLIGIYQDTRPFMYDIDLLNQIHDSILFQYPIGNWKRMARAVLQVKGYIDPVLTYKNREFKIGTDMKIGFNWGQYDTDDNPEGVQEKHIPDNINELADLLESRYAEATS